MKRFLSIMLVAVLVMGCLPTLAFAAGDQEKTFTCTVSGEFVNFSGTVNVSGGMQIVSITGPGLQANMGSGKVIWSGTENVSSYSFSVTVRVPASATCGTYSASFSGVSANKATKNDDGTPGKNVATSVSVKGGATIEVEHSWDNGVKHTDPDCGNNGSTLYTCTICAETKTVSDIPATGNHTWSNWVTTQEPTCSVPGSKERTCGVCGAKETDSIATIAHDLEMKHDASNHWYECKVCHAVEGTEAHNNKCVKIDDKTHKHTCKTCGYETAAEDHNFTQWKKKDANVHSRQCENCGHSEEEAHDFVNGKCKVCGFKKNTNSDDVPDMGDITPYGTYNAMVLMAVVVVLFSVVALINKRKSVN